MGNIFDILGPVMVGPSSSHTAGAARIGLIARQLFGRQPERAKVYLHGSFAATGKGHGTDKALIAGLLGMLPDDMRIPQSFEIAKEEGMDFVIENKDIKGAHPNTAQIIMDPLQIVDVELAYGVVAVAGFLQHFGSVYQHNSLPSKKSFLFWAGAPSALARPARIGPTVKEDKPLSQI